MVSVHIGVFDLEDVAAAGGKAKVIGKISCLNRKVRKEAMCGHVAYGGCGGEDVGEVHVAVVVVEGVGAGGEAGRVSMGANQKRGRMKLTNQTHQ